jgi:hypothetical protein
LRQNFFQPDPLNLAPWAGAAIPNDNAKAESFMKTLKVEAVYLMA